MTQSTLFTCEMQEIFAKSTRDIAIAADII